MTRDANDGRPLVLIPTPLEATLLLGARARSLGAPRAVSISGRRVVAALAGVGLAAAGAVAGRWLALLQPRRAALVGACGTLDRGRLAVGALLEAEAVACDGVGAGEGAHFVELAVPPLARSLAGRTRLDRIRCAAADARRTPSRTPALAGAVRGELLSVAAAADSPRAAALRRRRHPRALAEEMEGYAVALAARLARVPLVILRGASNVAGERDLRRWRLAEALARCRAALEEWVALVTS